MAQYVDGFVIPIPRKNLRAYKKMADWGRRVWMKHGALHYYECSMDDFPKHGMGFQKNVQTQNGRDSRLCFYHLQIQSP